MSHMKIDEIQAVNNIINNTAREALKVEGHYPVVYRHDHMRVEGMEMFAEHPYRVRAGIEFSTSKALAQYIADYKTETTRVFADLREHELRAVFDYHKPDGTPGWCEHTAELNLTYDADYLELLKMDGMWQTQQDFVNAINDLAGFITTQTLRVGDMPVEVSKADVMELVREMKAMTVANVEGSVGTSSVSGSSSYASKVTAKGNELPEQMVFRLPVFRGEQPIDHPFRIESRHSNGSINLRLTLIRRDKVREVAFEAIVMDVAERADVAIYGL